MIPFIDWVKQLFIIRPSSRPTDQQKIDRAAVIEAAAAHEVGHVIVILSDPFSDVESVTIDEYGSGLVEFNIKSSVSESYLKWVSCAVSLGGLSGGLAALGKFRSEKCSEDLNRARLCAEYIAARRIEPPWDEVGTWSLPFRSMYSDGLTNSVEKVMLTAFRRARHLINARADAFDAARWHLEEKRALSPSDLKRFFGPRLRL